MAKTRRKRTKTWTHRPATPAEPEPPDRETRLESGAVLPKRYEVPPEPGERAKKTIRE